MGLGQFSETSRSDEDVLFEVAGSELACHGGFYGENHVLLDKSLSLLTISLGPPRAEKWTNLMGAPPENVSKCMLVLRVASLRDQASSRLVDKVPRNSWFQN